MELVTRPPLLRTPMWVNAMPDGGRVNGFILEGIGMSDPPLRIHQPRIS